MARDLLTPDEVKQLHYKTIIFPIIGYPIFRDTVMYNKFSCYEKGEIERRVNPIIEKLNEVFKDITYEVEFLRKNDTAYVQVTINREKTNEIWLKVNSCIDQEYFHIEDLSKADKTIFNIHVKGLTEMLSLLNKNL